MLDLIAVSLGQALIPLLFSTIITTTLKKTGVINHLYRLKMLVAYTLLCFLGNLILGVEHCSQLLVIPNVVLFAAAILSFLFYLYCLIRSRMK